MHFHPNLVYYNADFVLAYKPAEASFHGDQTERGFAAQLQAELGESLYPVHRLDRMTSGLILFARHVDAARALGAQFQQGEIAKYYLAISDQQPGKKQGWIKGLMEKGRNGAWKLSRNQGVLAVTQFFSSGLGQGLRVFVVRPRTGRTHQIRVALKSVGSPIVGDARYGGSDADRGYLHAWALRLQWQGQTLSFIEPPREGRLFLDPSFRQKLADVGEPWDLDWPKWQAPKPLADND